MRITIDESKDDFMSYESHPANNVTFAYSWLNAMCLLSRSFIHVHARKINERFLREIVLLLHVKVLNDL
jgi:hypothetical protein